MAFKVTQISEVTESVEVGENLWLADDRETVVAEGDPRAAFLLATSGKRLARDVAEGYGLIKARKQSVEDKQLSPSENKAADLIAQVGDLSNAELQELRKDDRKSVVAAAEKELRRREETQ